MALVSENCFSDIENFTMTQVKYLDAPNGSKLPLRIRQKLTTAGPSGS